MKFGFLILTLAASAALFSCGGYSTGPEAPTGSGTGTSTHKVDLSWDASTSPNIAGYNIHRAVYSESCGNFFKINSELNTSTSYTDSEVTGGASYCYATTAVNTSNEESSYSNVVTNIQIPVP